MIGRSLLAAATLALCTGAGSAAPWDSLTQRSISRSRQFVVYSEDPNARAAVAMAAEDAKDKLLNLLQAQDAWKHPIVIQLEPASAADPDRPLSDVRIVNTDDGFKVVFEISIGTDPGQARQARFPQQLIRALVLELAYRDQRILPPAGGADYAQPPEWLVCGLAALTADPDPAASSSLFRSLIESGKTPALGEFLSENPATLDSTSLTLYSACSMSLVRLLTGLPNGPALLQGYIRHLPEPGADPEAELLKAFPGLNTGSQGLEKWWTLGLASLSAADRYRGLTLDETSRQLDALLTFPVAADKSGDHTRTFSLGQYQAFAKLPGATAALNTLGIRLLGLEGQAAPVMREVVSAYQDIVTLLLHHRSRDLGSRLEALAAYRKRLTTQMDQIADYLNWYEATQTSQPSHSFDDYLRTASEADQPPAPSTRTDPITRYMDAVEQELSQ